MWWEAIFFFPNHILPNLLLKLISSEGQSEVCVFFPNHPQFMRNHSQIIKEER